MTSQNLDCSPLNSFVCKMTEPVSLTIFAGHILKKSYLDQFGSNLTFSFFSISWLLEHVDKYGSF